MTDPYVPPGSDSESAPAPEVPAISPFAAIAGTFSSPDQTFGRLVRKPTWWLPLVLYLVLAIAFFLVAKEKIDWDGAASDVIAQSAAKGNTIPAEAAPRIASMMKVTTTYGAPIFVLIAFFGAILILWGASRAFGAESTFSQLAALWGHANLPNIGGLLIGIPIVLGQGEASIELKHMEHIVKANVGAFLPEGTGPFLMALGGSLDVFALASLVLLVIGFRRLPALPRGTATAIPIVLWALWVVGKAAMAGMRG